MSAGKPIAYSYRNAEAKIKSRDEQIAALKNRIEELQAQIEELASPTEPSTEEKPWDWKKQIEGAGI